MKKLFALVLVALLLIPSAWAETDLASLDPSAFAQATDEALQHVIDLARNELFRRQNEKTDGMTYLADQDGILFYLTGNYRIKNYPDDSFFYLEYILINDSDAQVSAKKESCYLNGWVSPLSVGCTVDPGKKIKDEFLIKLTDFGITSIEEIEEVEMTLYLRNAETSKKTYLPTVTLYFGE